MNKNNFDFFLAINGGNYGFAIFVKAAMEMVEFVGHGACWSTTR